MAIGKTRTPRRNLSTRRPKKVLPPSPPPPPPPAPTEAVPHIQAWASVDQTAQQVRAMSEERARRWFAATHASGVTEPLPVAVLAESITTDAAKLVKRPLVEVSNPEVTGEGGLRANAIVIPAQYQEILRRVTAIEEALAALSTLRAGIGHNQPPEPIELDGFDSEDKRAVEAAISTVKALPPSPATPPEGAREAAAELARIGTKAKEYATKQGDNFVSEIVKSLAKTTAALAGLAGVALSVDYVLYMLAERLLGAADAIEAWLDLIGSLR
jgi:hypothetical protein